MIVIIAKKDGFRRCGVPHSKTPVEYPDGHWSDEQLEILKAESMLVVNEVKKKAKTPIDILDRDK